MSAYNIRFKQAIEFLQTEKNYNYTIIVNGLKECKEKYYKNKRNIATSSSSITRMCDGTKEVTKPILVFVEKYLSTLGIFWNEEQKKYEIIEDETIFEQKYERKNPLQNAKGVYKMYHLSNCSNSILKNIIRISENGNVSIDGYENCTHKGKAQVFKGSFLSIQMDTLVHQNGEKEPFYYQIFANLNGNIQYGKIYHFFGISTTVSLGDEAMANKRVFVKLSNNENEQNQDWFHELIKTKDKTAIEKLNQSETGKIADYLLENSNLIVKEKANQKLH